MKHNIFLSSLLIATVWFVFGCDDDPATPPETDDQPGTFSETVEAFAMHLAQPDTTALDGLLSPDFKFYTGLNAEVAGTDSLSRDQIMLAFANMHLGTLENSPCRITRFQADMWSSGDWTDQGDGTGPDGCWRCSYSVDIVVERFGCESVHVRGQLRFYVHEIAPDGGSQDSPRYLIRGIQDRTWDKSAHVASDAFVVLIDMYLPAGLPRAHVACDRVWGTDATVFRFDASSSACSGLGLAPEPYRWRAGDDSVWSDWSSDPVHETTFPDTGPITLTLEARNTVGWTSRTGLVLEVVAEWPSTPDELLASFAYHQSERDIGGLSRLVGHHFRFDLMEYDVDHHGLPDDHFDYFDFMSATVNVFSATQVPFESSGSIGFLWSIGKAGVAGRSEPEDPVPFRFTVPVLIQVAFDNADDIWVNDNIEVYGSLRDTVLIDGTEHGYWIFDRMTDVSFDSPYSDMSWGGLLATFLE